MRVQRFRIPALNRTLTLRSVTHAEALTCSHPDDPPVPADINNETAAQHPAMRRLLKLAIVHPRMGAEEVAAIPFDAAMEILERLGQISTDLRARAVEATP